MEIYDRLLQFTLFQGMSSADLMQVAGHTKFGFNKLNTGKRLVSEGTPCTHLIFLTSGTLGIESRNDSHTCRVCEEISAPYIVQPLHLFGYNQHYTSTFKALSTCNFITLDKQEVMLLLETQLVFRLNMLNLLAHARPAGHREPATAPQPMAASTQKPAGAHHALFLLTVSLPRRSQDIQHTHETTG